MKCFYIGVYFMVGNILFSNGQTISGIVKDSSDDTPVAGVNIVMPSLKKGRDKCPGQNSFLKMFLPGIRTSFFVCGYERSHESEGRGKQRPEAGGLYADGYEIP